MSTFVGLTDKEAKELLELITTVESDVDETQETSESEDYDSEDNVPLSTFVGKGIPPTVSQTFLQRPASRVDTNEVESDSNRENSSETESQDVEDGTESDGTSESEDEPPTKRKKKNTLPKFQWKTGHFTPKMHNSDDSNSGFHHDDSVTDDSNFVDYFEQFFTEELVTKIASETNKYLLFVQKTIRTSKFSRLTKWKDTNHKEIYTLLAVTMLVSRNKKLKLSECWSRDPLLTSPIFGKIMSRDRYMLLLRLLHFCDNDNQRPGDRLYKLEVVLNYLKNRFKEIFTPFQNLCIDESMILFKGRLSFRQYMKSKRHRFGIKFFVLVDVETDFVLDFIIYTGATSRINQTENLGVSGSIVTTLMAPHLEKGHTLYTDNWYTSPLLAKHLYDHQTNLCGTVKQNRIGMPQLPKLKTKGTTVCKYSGPIMVLKWMDRREVVMLSTLHDGRVVDTDKVDHKTKEKVRKPAVVKDYNENMGAVDKIDMLLSSVECLRKTVKWYKKVFFHLVDLAVINACVTYKIKTGNHIPLADFQLELIRQLLARYVEEESPNARLGRPSTKDVPTRLQARHYPSKIPSVPGGKKASQRICYVCKHTQLGPKKRSDSRYQCTQCDVGLCVTPCFEKYHTLNKF